MFNKKIPSRNRRIIINANEAPKRSKVSDKKPRGKSVLIFSIIVGMVLIACFLLEGLGSLVLHHKKTIIMKNNAIAFNNDGRPIKNLAKKNDDLVKQIRTLAPDQTYIVVDTARNILFLKQGDKITRTVSVATGTGNVLTEPDGRKRSWTFDTPRGEFSVKNIRTDPKWTAPDWEFISSGEEIPRNKNDRIKEGYLGDYALGLGNDIMIHGTIYTRTIGKHATHGCIRVGDDDLLAIYKSSKVGTKVFMF
jgi:L,D-transpeptidase ErfK/SrfK